MMELEVILDLSCYYCWQSMGVTVRCAGKGLARGSRARATVKVPCPGCGNINKVIFAPDGTLYQVSPCELSKVPEPSLN